MEHVGAIEVSRQSTDSLGNHVYSVAFVPASADERSWPGRRFRGDLALVRTLEALVPDPDVRRRALQRVHDAGRASIGGIILSEEQAVTLGLGRKGPAGLERDLAAEVAVFLTETKGRSFCHTCLAGLVGIEFEEARKVVYGLRVTRQARVGTARCSACHQHRVTIAA